MRFYPNGSGNCPFVRVPNSSKTEALERKLQSQSVTSWETQSVSLYWAGNETQKSTFLHSGPLSNPKNVPFDCKTHWIIPRAAGGNGQCFGDSSADHGYLGQDFLFRVPVIVGVKSRWTTLNLILSKKVGNAVQEKDNWVLSLIPRQNHLSQESTSQPSIPYECMYI